MAGTEQQASCNNELVNPIISMGLQYSGILVISHVLQILLKPLGQASPIVQILVSMSSSHKHLYECIVCMCSCCNIC